MLNWLKLIVLYTFVMLVSGFTSAFGQAIDPHQLYEHHCARCHAPHAGDFVHDELVYFDDKILGRKSRQELGIFLNAGHGKLTMDESIIIVSHLTNIQQSGRTFHDKCLVCHGRAVEFVRMHLLIKEEQLIGRFSKRNIESFLTGHGRLDADEISKMIVVLTRLLDTAGKWIVKSPSINPTGR